MLLGRALIGKDLKALPLSSIPYGTPIARQHRAACTAASLTTSELITKLFGPMRYNKTPCAISFLTRRLN